MNQEPDLAPYIDEWNNLKAWLATGKEREMVLRTYIAARLFTKEPNGCFKEGTSKATTDGYRAKLDAKIYRDIMEELLIPTLTEANLTAEEQKGLIKGKPELSIAAYKKLPPDKRAIIDKMLVVKPGAITLEVDPLPK
jgi:hypothetical protein